MEILISKCRGTATIAETRLDPPPESMSDTQQELLDELRRLRQTVLWSTIFAMVPLLAVMGYVVMRMPRPAKSRWSEVNAAMRASDYTKALNLAQPIVATQPEDFYGHQYLGRIYVDLGDTEHAESEYARAYDLWPSDEIGKELETVRKRRANEHRATPAPPAANPVTEPPTAPKGGE
jgi:cytochrome c-type biogenesis protein CcmH/NrfG